MSKSKSKAQRRQRDAQWKAMVKARARGELPIKVSLPKPPDDKPQAFYLTEYEITEKPLADKQLPQKVRAQYEELYCLVHDQPKTVIGRLKELIEEFPNVPQLYNFLATAYSGAGETAKAEEMAELNYRRNPDYLFAKANYAELCLYRGELEKIPEIFDNTFDLKMLYPHRKLFHISEFVGFTYVMAAYFWRLGRKEVAERYFQMLQEVAPDHPAVERLTRLMALSVVGKALERLQRMLSRKRRTGR
jgi:tetratricopeptide (TPR) repeat protein